MRNILLLTVLVAGIVAAPMPLRGATGNFPDGFVIHREEATFVRDTLEPMNVPRDDWWVFDKNTWGLKDGGEVHRNAMSFVNGVLRLAVQPKKKSDADYPGMFPSAPYWTGHYASKMGESGNYNEDAPACQSHKYGRFEARWKAAAVGGTVSSFFTVHHEKFPGSDEARDWSEFDFEFFSRTNILSLNLHYTDREVDVWKSHRQTGKDIALDFDPTAGFHTYACEWTPDSLTWLIDEVRIYSRLLTPGEIRDLASAGGRTTE